MKIVKKLFLIVAILSAFTAISIFGADAASCSLKARTNATNLNVRSGASTSSTIVTSLKNPTDVTLLNTKLYNSEWYKIKLSDGTQGYVYKDYLDIKSGQLFIPQTVTGYNGYKVKYKVINTTDSTAKWTSSDSTVATVNKKGVAKCLKNGTTTITVTAGSVTSKSTLTVKNADVKISSAPTEIFLDETCTVKVSCKKKVTFTSSDTAVATVNSDGEVTPVAKGKVTITATSKSGTASCTIKIKKRTIDLKMDNSTLYVSNRRFVTPSGGLQAYSFKSSDTNVFTVDSSGMITAKGAGTAKLTVTSGDLSTKKSITVKSGKYIDISHTSGTVRAGMTLYLKSNTSGVVWSSSDSSIAKIENGYVLGVNKGKAIITVTTSSGASDCLVTVESPQAVRFVYPSENSAFAGDTVTFNAITDMQRSAVKFKITAPNGSESWITNVSKSTEDSRYIWSCSKALTVTGVYTITAYAKTSTGDWQTETSGQCTTFVSKVTKKNQVAFGERRASTDAINIIAEHEGFVGTVYTDTMAGVPTVGYGRVVYAGSTFYNGMTKKEAFAFLIKTVNESGFTSRMNKILTENNIKFSQQQFDALIDFSYNLGAYAITNDDDLFNTLLNSYGSDNYKKKGFINSLNVTVTQKAKSGAKVIANFSAGDEVTLVKNKVYNSKWYKILLEDGTKGFVLCDKITRRTTNTAVRNLNNVKVKTFAKYYLPYHHASSQCYVGLLRRRVDEVETFFYGDYVRDGQSNKYGLSYTCSKNSSIKI